MDPFYIAPDVEDQILANVKNLRRQQASIAASVTEEAARRAIALTRAVPNASGGLVGAAAMEGTPPELVAQLAEQDDGGFSFGGLIGNVADFVGDRFQDGYEQIIKPVVRSAFTLSEGLAQEVVQRPLTAALTAFTDDNATGFQDAYNQYGDSPLLNIAQGEVNPFDEGAMGEGFFTGGAAQQQSMADRTLTIDGKMASLGRALPTTQLAGEVFGNDSFAYNLAAGVGQFAFDVVADPLAGGLGAAAKGAKALRTIDASQAARAFGAVQGGGRASALLEEMVPKLANREVLSALAKADANTIWKSVKRSAANQFDADILRRLGNAATEDEVAEVLLDAAQQKKVTETGFYSGLRGTRRKVRDHKFAGVAARGTVSYDDIPDAMDKVDSLLKQARVGDDDRAGIINRLVDLEGVDAAEKPEQFFAVMKDAMLKVSDNLDGEQAALARMIDSYGGDFKALREYGIDKTGEIIPTPFVKRLEDGTMTPTIQLTSELADMALQLPDVTAIRRAAKRATRAEKLYASKGWTLPADGARWVTRELFKPLAILRPAYVLRIGLEEQFRLTAAGYDSILTHPFRFIQSNIMARSIDESFSGKAGDFLSDAEVMHAVNRRAHALLDDGAGEASHLSNWDQLPKGDKPDREFTRRWRSELGQIRADAGARHIAQNGYDLDGFVSWARGTADGRKWVDRLEKATKGKADLASSDDAVRNLGHSIAVRIASKAGGKYVKEGENYIVKSLGDDDLLRAIGQDGVDGIDLAAKFDVAPDVVKFPIDSARTPGGSKGALNRGVDYLYETLAGKPTNTLARYPAFRQAYIKYARESMDAVASDELRQQFAARMGDMFNLTKKEMRDLTKSVAGNSKKAGYFDDLTELDEVIKHRAAQETKDLLFDATKRSNFQEAYEVATPFFDAWAEVTQTWARLLKENPGFFIKAMQGLDSARQSGVIYANDFGEEVFAYPGGGMLSKFFPGEDSVKFEGRLQGANLVAQGVGPGFGPVVQWGVGAFLPKTRELQALREWLAPFGTGGIESAGDISDPSAILDSVIPAWARKFSNAVTGGKIDEVQWNSTMGDVAKVLANSGAYDPANPDDQQRLLNDAQRGAKTILLMRSLTQGVGITGASATWQVKTDGDEGEAIPTDWSPEADPDGTWHSIGILANEYRRLRDFYNYDDDIAASVFLDMYGVEPFYISQAKTRSISELPVDEQGDFWIREHAEVAETYPAIIGYFVPPDEDAPLDYAIYRDQITRGDRQSLTAKQQIQLANQVKARAFRDNIKERVSALPSSARSDVMAQVSAYLEDEYPGWQNPVLGVDAKLRSSQKIDQLQLAVNDERLADSPVTGPLRDYLKVRDGVLAIAGQRGLKTLTSDKVSDLREALMEYGLQLKQSNPEFAGVWTRLLASEVRE